MKPNPKESFIRDDMVPGRLAAGGFLGDDRRNLQEIVDSDRQLLEERGVTAEQIAAAMRRLTEKALQGFGDEIDIDETYRGQVLEFMGWFGCPFKDNRRAAKRNTTITNRKTGQTMSWTDLTIHLIEAHGFFQGRGADFRLEPADLIQFLGLAAEDKVS